MWLARQWHFFFSLIMKCCFYETTSRTHINIEKRRQVAEMTLSQNMAQSWFFDEERRLILVKSSRLICALKKKPRSNSNDNDLLCNEAKMSSVVEIRDVLI